MANLSLIRFDRDGLELFVDQATGRAYAGINATARMCGRNESTIRSLVSARDFELLEAEIQTVKGLQGARLLSSEQVFEVALKYCPELAKKMGACGANVYMCGVAGYKVAVTTNETLQRLEKQFLPTPTQKELKEGHGLYKLMYGKPYADRWLQQKVKDFYPSLAPVEEPKPEEKASLPTAKALLTPTQVAEQLGWHYSSGNGDAMRVNRELHRLGCQEKIAGQWSSTAKAIDAKLCDRKPVDTDSRTQKDQLLWSADIVAVLQEFSTAK